MTVLVSDSFNRANSTTTLGTTDSYNGGTAKTWNTFGTAIYGIQNNKAYPSTFVTDAPYFVDSLNADVKISVNYNATGGIYFRIVDNTHWFRVVRDGSTLYLQYKDGGGISTLGTKNIAFVTGEILSVITKSDGTIQVFVNSVLQITVTNTLNATNTKQGFGPTDDSSATWDNFIIEDLGISGTVYNKSLSDSITLSESLNKALSKNKILTDSIISSESLTKISSKFKSMFDTVTLTDTKNQLTTKTKNDTIINNDSITPVYNQNGQTYTKSLSDSINFIESLTKISSIRKTILETINTSDSLSKISSKFKALNDSISNSDNISKISNKNRIDSIILNDSMSKLSSKIKTDSIILNDSILKSLSKIKTDSVLFSDSLNKINAKFINDNIGLGESLGIGGNKNNLFSDFVTITDVIRKFVSRNKSDGVTLSDSQNRQLNRFISLSDFISSSENLQKNDGNGKSLSDFITLSDTISKKLFRTYIDSIITSEVENDKVTKNFLEAISQSDSINIFRGKIVNLSDFVNITDTIRKSLSKIQFDNIIASEINNKSVPKKVSDLITIADLLNISGGKALLLTDTILLSDTIFKSTGKIKLESILLMDSINKALGKNLFDITIISDKVTLFIPNIPEYEDIIEFILNINSNIEFNLNINGTMEFNLDIITYKNFNLNI